ncbi:MAG TPA: DUF4340 domain-containing protein [Gemmataceae bacterium]
MNFKTTYILFGLLLVLLLGVVLSLFFGGSGGGEGYLLPALKAAGVKPEEVNTLEIEQTRAGPAKLVFTRAPDGRWELTEPVKARVDSGLIDRIVREFLTARVEANAEVTSSLALHGLENPTASVTLRKGADLAGTVRLGNVTTGGSRALVFVLTPDAPDTPRAVPRGQIDGLFKQLAAADIPATGDAAEYVRDLSDFRSLNLLGGSVRVPTEEVRAVRLQHGDKVLALRRSEGGVWDITQPENFGRAEMGTGAVGAAGQVTGVRSLLSAVTSISVPSHDAYIEDVSDFAEYGLGDKEPATLSVRLEVAPRGPEGAQKPVTETLLVGKPVEDKGEDRQYYARLEGDSAVAKVPERQIKPLLELLNDPKAIRDKTLVHAVPSRVDAVTVQAGPSLIELYRTGSPEMWHLFDSAGNAQLANQINVDQLLSALTRPNLIKDFPAAGKSDAEMGFDNPQAEVKLWVEGIVREKKEEAKQEKKEGTKEEKKEAEEKPKEKKEAEEKPKEKAEKEKGEKKAGEPVARPKLKGEPTVRLLFGKTEAEVVYVRRVADGKTADVMVSKDILGEVTRDRLQYLDPRLEGFDAGRVTRLTFTHGGKTYEVHKEKPEEEKPPSEARWQIAQPEELKGRSADADKVALILKTLAGLTPQKLIDDNPSAATLERLGLKPDAARTRAVVTLGADKDKAAQRVYLFGDDTADKTGVYAKVGERNLVFTVPPGELTLLRQGEIQDMVVLRIDPAKVTGLKLTGWTDVVGSAVTRELRREGGTWSLEGKVGYELDPQKVQNFLLDLATVRAEKFEVYKSGAKPEHRLQTDQGALEITIRQEGEKEPVTLTLGGPDPTKKFIYAQTSALPGDVFTLLQDRFGKLKQSAAVFRKE